MRTVLEDHGYRVIEAVDGEDGIRQFRKNADVDLIVSDMVMPKMNGAEMYQEIKKTRPGMKALFTSGYAAGAAIMKGIHETGLELVLKPVSPADLLRKVREALDGAKGAGNDGIFWQRSANLALFYSNCLPQRTRYHGEIIDRSHPV